MRPILLLLVAVCVGSLLSLDNSTRGEEFRIETKMYVTQMDEPVNHSTTLFLQETVYDFLDTPQQVAVFKKSITSDEGRFSIIDPQRKIKAELTTDQILEFLSRVAADAEKLEDPIYKFSVAPKFAESFEQREGQLTLDSPVMRYHLLTLQVKNEEVTRQYHEFSDWYARLGTVFRPGTYLPFPRLRVNELLARNEVLPHEVTLTLPAAPPHRTEEISFKTEHRVTWRLSKKDRAAIDEVNGQLVTFKRVALGELLKIR